MSLPILVLLPGLDGTGKNFQPLLDALPPSQQTLIIRYGSEPHDLLALVAEVRKQLPSSDHLLIAESFSGPVAIALASQAPPGCVGLVLVATFVRFPLRLPRVLPQVLARVMFAIPPPHWALRLLLLGGSRDTKLVGEVAASISETSSAALAQRLRLLTTVDVRPAFATVELPTLYLQATNDRVVPAHNLRDLQEIRSELSVGQIEAPHLVLQCEPVAAIELIQSWWTRESLG